MQSLPAPVSRVLFVLAFAAVASSTGLQWMGLSAQGEAARQQKSRQSLEEFSATLLNYDEARGDEKLAVAEQLSALAEKAALHSGKESVVSASRRAGVLASYEIAEPVQRTQLQDHLRSEVRWLITETERLESVALGRAVTVGRINQAVLILAAVLCGILAVRGRRFSWQD